MNQRSRAWVRWLDEIADEDGQLAGGKAVNLARLRRANFETPRGFVIDTAQFRQTRLHVGTDILPQQAEQMILDYYRQLKATTVAVRSSATFEDSSTRSFAGQARTVLNVQMEDSLLEAVRTVLDSMNEESLQEYAQQMGVSAEGLAMHVVVQEMVDAEAAGVIFTVNPLSGCEDEILINATWGLGEPLVSGRVTPDQLVVGKYTGHCASYTVGGKEEVLTLSGAGPTPTEKAECRCLNPEQIERLAEVARQIEAHFKAPQDIEWAWRDKLYVLQTRPLTTIPLTDTPESVWRQEVDRLCSVDGVQSKVWVAAGIAELLPCPTPLSWDVASRLMSGREGYGLAHRRIGYDPAPETILERIGGHTFVDLDRELELFFRHAPLGYASEDIRQQPLRAAMPRQTFQWRKLRPGVLARLPILVFRLIRLLLRLRRLRRDYLPFFQDRFLPQFNTYIRAQREADCGELSDNELVDVFERRLEHFLHDSSPVLMTGSILAAMSYRDVEDLLIDRMGSEGIALTQRLLTGLRPNPTIEMHEAMSRVAHGEESEEAFLDQFGHRCGNEFELATPRWREDLSTVREQIAHAKHRRASSPFSDQSTEQPAERQRVPHVVATAQLRKLETEWGHVQQDLIRTRLDTARRLLPLRELTKNYLMMEYELLRRPLVELDRRLELDGGVFYLHCNEIRAAVNGQLKRSKIDIRRQRHQLFQRLRLPRVVVGDQLVERPSLRSMAQVAGIVGHTQLLQGIGVSAGVVRGRVRTLNSVADLVRVQQDEILVVPLLDPTWTTAYSHTAGLVAERGAMLSHGAILAREFSLPAVVNIAEATSRLRTGQEVELDGTAGTVRLLDDRH